jgi:hypothetical protein
VGWVLVCKLQLGGRRRRQRDHGRLDRRSERFRGWLRRLVGSGGGVEEASVGRFKV